MLEKTESEFRFLDEAANGHTGLEKAYMLNPDIIILDLWSGFLDGYYILEKLKEKNYLSKVIVIEKNGKHQMNESFENVCGSISEETLTDSVLYETLSRVAKTEIIATDHISANLYQDIVNCKSTTEFALLNDKYNLNLKVGEGFYIITCRILNQELIPERFIAENIQQFKELLTYYNDGCVFCNQGIVFFLVNDTLNIKKLFNGIYAYVKSIVGSQFYYFASKRMKQIETIIAGMNDAPTKNKYCFFNSNMGILYEEYLDRNKSCVSKSDLLIRIRDIQYDIKESDIHKVVKDISDLFISTIKKRMDFAAYDFVCSRLGHIYYDVLTQSSLPDIVVPDYSNAAYIEETAEIYCDLFRNLMFKLNPVINESPVIVEAISFIRTNYNKNLSLKMGKRQNRPH